MCGRNKPLIFVILAFGIGVLLAIALPTIFIVWILAMCIIILSVLLIQK